MGQPTLYPDNSLSYVQNFIRMSFGFPTEPYEFNDEITRALETLLILHVDHEQNCSTSTVRMVASSGANMYAAVAAGVNALSGPKHGGANQAVLEMLQFIRDSGMTTKEFVRKVKDKESDIKLMALATGSTRTTIHAPPSSRNMPTALWNSIPVVRTFSRSPRNLKRPR
ncbi:citrate synthase [Cutibacterium acnes JCM 18918]|nr:citrate synthase [Cutibacterium acnes JCM 18918]